MARRLEPCTPRPVLALAAAVVLARGTRGGGAGAGAAEEAARVVIAVGDSLTDARVLSGGATQWPARLSDCAGWGAEVPNFGVSGATMQRESDLPYWGTAEYQAALASRPDVVYLMLGTNDAKVVNWNASRYARDAGDLVASFTDLPTRPHVYLVTPPPLFVDGVYTMQQGVINSDLPRLIPEIARSAGPNVSAVDAVFKVFGGAGLTCEDCVLADGCHTTDYGRAQIALALCIVTAQSCSCPSYVARESGGGFPKEVICILAFTAICALYHLCGLCLWKYLSRRRAASASWSKADCVEDHIVGVASP